MIADLMVAGETQTSRQVSVGFVSEVPGECINVIVADDRAAVQ